MKIFLVSLGCDKNRVDSEEMLGLLAASGFSFCNDEHDADIIVVNTCCFIDPAKEESIETILEMAAMKQEGRCRKLIVTGCMAERYRDEIKKELPEVDAVIGVNELEKIISACDPEEKEVPAHERVITTPGHYEFLKIAEGCNKRCTYCIIPYIRGAYRSFPFEQLVSEAKYLASQGVKELILVAQETTIYGKDLYGHDRLPELLKELCRIEGIRWIRVLYTYPEDITDELLDVMASEDKILKYIDMPIQHSADRILKRMGRRTSHDDLVNIISNVRNKIPDVALRTSLISGFPGETEEDHRELMEFVKEIRFDRLGVFSYSQEEGTPAARFEDQVPQEVRDRRRDEIMSLQEKISAENLSSCEGNVYEVMIEGFLPDDEVYVGRTYMDAPDVDGFFYVSAERSLMTGDIIKAVCTGSSQYDLYGEMIQ
ncbi:MAG: 30S ribosomal protein S12 methylthiotransferase RimO [Lachnospiraceae bacterium]|nr:30S ribosomal protein S12 methylthiotransferase RimO [Lachnospiraceae bacterium]